MFVTEDPQRTITRWIDDLSPLRILLVGQTPSPIVEQLDRRLEDLTLSSSTRWQESLPPRFRPLIERINPEDIDGHQPVDHYDLIVCLESLSDLPVGLALSLVHSMTRLSRFVIVRLTRATLPLPLGIDPACWHRRDFSNIPIIDKVPDGSSMVTLIRGGRSLPRRRREKCIHYLSPNRLIHGGVKILYNHVDILQSIGHTACLTVREKANYPASWFAWNPNNIMFDEDAESRVGNRDTVVIPEFRFREVQFYSQAARRILFVQNPGLCFDIDRWREMGYDGVLTLNCPNGRESELYRWLRPRTDLPMFCVTNHYSDDAWGHSTADRIPGRILCLPRKGLEFIERLENAFENIVRVDNVPQSRMAYEMARADVYVHTGFPEGQPMPPIEAMLSGCVVCGFTGRGGLDVMKDNQTAYVADDGNIEQLAHALSRALHDPKREQVRAAGRATCRAFTREVTANELRRFAEDWLPTIPANSRPLKQYAARSSRTILNYARQSAFILRSLASSKKVELPSEIART